MGYCEGRVAFRIILADEGNPVIDLSPHILFPLTVNPKRLPDVALIGED